MEQNRIDAQAAGVGDIGLGDRIARALFVALAVGLGWGIRGDFGHMIGASYPGAALGLAFAYVSGQRAMWRWMPIFGAVTGLGISTGGSMSYGILHGYAQSDTFINYSYGFLTLFLEGGAWGVFGCAAAGLLLEQKRLGAAEWIEGFGAIVIAGILLQTVVVGLLGFHINPPRSDASIGFTGGAIGLFGWLIYRQKRCGLKAALLGYIGFGLGMSLGRLFGNIAHVMTTVSFGTVGPFSINHWNVMEVSVGLIGGFIFTFGMLGKRAPEPPEGRTFTIASVLGAVYVAGLIPLLHRLTRIEPPKRLEEWTSSLQSYGYLNAGGIAIGTLWATNLLCLAGFGIAAYWLFQWYRGNERWGWYPVLKFSGVMLLFQNLNALFFFYPHQPNQINMHVVFWVLYALMGAYVIVRWRWAPHSDDSERPEAADRMNYAAWVGFAVAAYVLIVLCASFVNGPTTMKCANTRWPVWSWNDGPFPGTEKQ